MKTPRRRMRLAVFKALFQHEFRRDEDLEQILEEILDETYDKKAKEDARRYIRGIKENLPMIDNLISRYLRKVVFKPTISCGQKRSETRHL